MGDAQYGEGRALDFDTGAGTDLVEVSGIVFPASGGAVAVGGVLETGTNAVGGLAVGGGTPHDSVDSGNPIKIGGRASTTIPTAVASGDRVNAWYGVNGQQYVGIADASGNLVSVGGNALYVTAPNGISVAQDTDSEYSFLHTEAVSLGLWVSGETAHDAVDAGRPIKIGGKANDSAPTQVANADRVDAWLDRRGALFVRLTDSAGTAIATGVQYVEDAAITANAGQGTLVVARRDDVLGSLTPVEGDAVGLRVDSVGALWVHPADGSGIGMSTASGVGDAMTFVENLANGGGDPAAPLAVVPRLYNGATLDRIRSVSSVSAAPNVDTGILAVGHGPGFDRKTNPTGVAATSTANAVEVLVNGADSISFHVTTIGTTPGSMIIETTGDDTNWATAGAVIKLGSVETFIEGSFVPAVNDIYLVRTTGLRRVRYRVNAVYASGTATVKVTSSIGSPVIKAVEMPGAPHKIGYAIASATNATQFTTAQTSTVLGPTVTSAQRMVVTSLQIQAGGTTSGTVSVYFGTGAITKGTSKSLFEGEFAPSATSKPGFYAAPSVPFMGAADEEVRVTSVGSISLFVTIWYYIVAA